MFIINMKVSNNNLINLHLFIKNTYHDKIRCTHIILMKILKYIQNFQRQKK